jgi:uncharacterized small protein (DUF1192 family)
VVWSDHRILFHFAREKYMVCNETPIKGNIMSKFKSAAKSVGSATLTVATVLVNSSANVRIAEIDDEIAKLQAEKAKLQSGLVTR